MFGFLVFDEKGRVPRFLTYRCLGITEVKIVKIGNSLKPISDAEQQESQN
jgi:hypothetical protein